MDINIRKRAFGTLEMAIKLKKMRKKWQNAPFHMRPFTIKLNEMCVCASCSAYSSTEETEPDE